MISPQVATSISTRKVARQVSGWYSGDVYKRQDASEVDVKAMSEHKHVALFQIWLDVFLVHICLKLIVDPVSYTHLDVYKRQVINTAAVRYILFVTRTNNAFIN